MALALAVAGCGGSDSTSSTQSTATNSDVASTTSSESVNPNEGSKQFLEKGSSTNGLVEFGKEASASEREAASKALTETLEAREDGDFEKQCATSAILVAKSITKSNTLAGARKDCARELKGLAVPLNKTKPFRVNTLDGEIAALRVKGKKAEALYHGNDGKDYAMPMYKEGDGWKAAALLTTELNPPKAEKPTKPEGPGSPSGTQPDTPAN